MPSDTSADHEIFANIAQERSTQALREVRLPPEARRGYDQLCLRAEDLIESARNSVSGLPSIYFDFVHHPEVNAFATREQGRYFIGVHTGLVFLFRLLIGRMLSDRALFPWIGDVSEERTDLPRIDFYVPHADQMWASEELVTPQNEVRRQYAIFIEDRALMFFVGHEIAHISQGHVDYWQHERGVAVYSERSDDGATLIERQSLELDADRRSVMTSVNSLRDMQASPEFKGLPWIEGPRDTASLFRDWAVVIAIVFRLVGDQRVSDVNLRRSHPPLLSRRLYAQGVGQYGVDLFWPATEREAARSSIREGTREVSRAFATIIGNALEELPAFPPLEYIMMLQDYWNEVLLEKVRPYSYEF